MKNNKPQIVKSKTENRKVSPARAAAFRILHKIDAERAFSSIVLPLFADDLDAKDRALCHEIVLGVLRRQIYLDRVTEHLTGGKKLDSAVRIICRIALYQLVFLDKIPPHAAINEAVNQTVAAKKTSAKGFVNAVLRRFTREQPELEFADELEKLSVETSHPRWLLEKWVGQFGFEEAAKLAAANNETPDLTYRLTAKTTEAVKNSLENAGETPDKNFLMELAAAGKIYFQDEASQIVGETVELRENSKFIDVCAAPGSKTTQIGAKFKDLSSKMIVAGDLHWNRVKFLQENCRRQGVSSVNVVEYDAERALPFADESFDAALVDAPCSGTGTIRHNPEIRYFVAEKDFAELQAKQLGILTGASKLIKRGGRLIYSTCSLETEENEAVCAKFMSENGEFRLIEPKADEKYRTADGFARTFPPRDDMDGFFIAVFEKI